MRVVLTGSGVNPTLNATLGNAGDNGDTVITPKLIGIETINVAFTGSGVNAVTDLDLQDATGAKHINITRVSQASNTAAIENIKDVLESMSVAGTNANETGTVEFSFGVGTLRGENTADLNVSDVQLGTLNIGRNTSGVGAATGVSIEGYEHLNLKSAGAENHIGTLNLPMDTGTNGSIVITGDQNLTLGSTIRVVNAANNTVESIRYQNGIQQAFGRLALIDASQFGADLTLYIAPGMLVTGKADTSGVRQDVSILGGAGDDTFILADQVEAGDSIDGGAGTDTLIVTTGGIVNANSSVITSVEHVEVRGDATATITVDFDKLPDANLIFVRNEGAAGGPDPDAPAAATLTTILNNLTAAQAAALKTEHSNTGSNGITQNIINANLKDATGNNDLVALAIDDGYNTDPRFNLTLNAANVENITIADNDTESNSIHLGTFAQTTGTITFTGGQTGKFMNLDTDAANANGLSGYGLDETGNLGSHARTAAGVLLPTRDGAVNSAIQNIDYRVLYNDIAAYTADVRLISQNIIAADYASDLIVRLADVTRTDGFSSQNIVGGSGNDTFIFDAQGVKNSGYTSGDTVKGGTGTDTLVIDGNTTAAKADGSAGVGGHVSVQKSEWDNTSGIDILRLAGNQGMGNGGIAARVDADLSVSTAGYYIEIDDDFVHQADAGNNLTIINNDGDLAINSESDLVLNLRDLAQTSNVTFIGANGDAVSAVLGTISSNRIQLADKSANGLNKLDGGDTDVTDTVAIGNNNVLHIFNAADVSIHDLSNTKNFGWIEFENDLAIAQTMKLTLNDTVVDALVDASHTATTTAVETLFIRAIDNALVAGATANLNVDASIVGAQFSLDIIGGGGTDIIVAGAGRDLIVGGAGADDLTGGDGNDVFTYTGTTAAALAAETGLTTATADVITDFVSGADTIDLFVAGTVANFYELDASSTAGDDITTVELAVAAANAAAGAGTSFDGTVQYIYVIDGTGGASNGYLVVDEDLNGTPDYAITLTGLFATGGLVFGDIV